MTGNAAPPPRRPRPRSIGPSNEPLPPKTPTIGPPNRPRGMGEAFRGFFSKIFRLGRTREQRRQDAINEAAMKAMRERAKEKAESVYTAPRDDAGSVLDDTASGKAVEVIPLTTLPEPTTVVQADKGAPGPPATKPIPLTTQLPPATGGDAANSLPPVTAQELNPVTELLLASERKRDMEHPHSSGQAREIEHSLSSGKTRDTEQSLPFPSEKSIEASLAQSSARLQRLSSNASFEIVNGKLVKYGTSSQPTNTRSTGRSSRRRSGSSTDNWPRPPSETWRPLKEPTIKEGSSA